MERRLIERIRFRYIWDAREWYMNDVFHRDDGGPAIEDMDDGYRAWWKHGAFVRGN